MAGRVPSAATILAGVNLDRVLASPLRQQLPPAALAFLESLTGARAVLVASDGGRYLVLTRGDFRQAPAGATLLAPGVAAAGSSDWLSAAVSRHNGGAANALLARAEPAAATGDIWLVAAGSATFPLSGNGDNVNRLLHATQYSTLSVRLTDQVSLDAVGVCRDPESARHVEETARAWVTLGAAGAARQSAVSGLLRRIQVSRADRAVHVTLVAQASELKAFF